jgi:hypothetical protein
MATERPVSSAQPPLQLTALYQLFCRGCVDLDERCTARLILAPRVSLKAVRAQPQPIKLHRNFAELERCGEGGCYLCRFWASVLLRECYSDIESASVRASPHPVVALPPISTAQPWVIAINAHSSNGDLLVGTAVLRSSPYVRGPGKISNLHFGTMLTPVSVLPRLKSWYMECHKSPTPNHGHWQCFKQWESSTTERIKFRPKRLLSLQSNNGEEEDTIKLVAGRDISLEGRYVALSYCW